MLRDCADAAEIVKAARHLLKAASAGERLPTPVDDIVAAAGLAHSQELPFDESVLRRAPAHLAEAVRKLGLKHKIHAMLDRRERLVYVNPEIQHDSRRRFRSLHEVGHDILPSQQALAYADNSLTLSWTSKMRLERDANQAAAELLFQNDLFRRMANDYAISMATVVELADMFGASYRSSLRRYAETNRAAVAGVVLDHSPCARDPLGFRRHEASCSPAWERHFGRPDGWPTVLQTTTYPFLAEAAMAAVWQSARSGEFHLPDLAKTVRELRVEVFSNSYSLLVLLWKPRPERLKRHRRIAEA